MGEAGESFAGREIVEHAHEVDVGASRVAEGVDEEAVGGHVVDPESCSGGTQLVGDALDCAARDEKLFEHAGIELVESVARAQLGGDSLIGGCYRGVGAIVADNGLDKAAYKIVGEGFASAGGDGLSFGDKAAVGVGHEVAPLVAVGVALLTRALRAQTRECAPGVESHLMVCVVVDKSCHSNSGWWLENSKRGMVERAASSKI